MKICLMNNLYPPYQRGGAEAIVGKMINDFQKNGHEVFLITTKPKEDKKIEDGNLKIYHIDSSYYILGQMNVVSKLFWHLANVFGAKKTKKIEKILRIEQPDLIITHNLMGLGFQLPRVIKELGIRHHHFLHDIQLLHPAGLMFHGNEHKVHSLFSRIYQAINRKLFSSVTEVISPSQWLLNEHTKLNFFSNSIQKIKPFNWSEKSNEMPGVNKFTRKTFLFVGQIEKHKGILLLINAFQKIDNPEIRLLIVGSGAELQSLQKIAQEDERIEFLGRKEGEALKKIMSQSHCLIVPSLCYENSPTIICQAQALGLPVLAANIGGIPEIIQKGDRLFTPNNEPDLIQKINETK